MKYWVYILYSNILETYYVGQTKDVVKRLEVHNRGGKKYTTKGIPWSLVETYECENRVDAVRLERKIKKRGIKRYLAEN